MYVHVCVNIYTHIMSIYPSISLSVCMYVCMYVRVFVILEPLENLLFVLWYPLLIFIYRIRIYTQTKHISWIMTYENIHYCLCNSVINYWLLLLFCFLISILPGGVFSSVIEGQAVWQRITVRVSGSPKRSLPVSKS